LFVFRFFFFSRFPWVGCGGGQGRRVLFRGGGGGGGGRRPVPRADLTTLKSESLNLLEPSGPVQACTGIALPCVRTVKMKMEATYLSKLTRVLPEYTPSHHRRWEPRAHW